MTYPVKRPARLGKNDPIRKGDLALGSFFTTTQPESGDEQWRATTCRQLGSSDKGLYPLAQMYAQPGPGAGNRQGKETAGLMEYLKNLPFSLPSPPLPLSHTRS